MGPAGVLPGPAQAWHRLSVQGLFVEWMSNQTGVRSWEALGWSARCYRWYLPGLVWPSQSPGSQPSGYWQVL